MGRIYQCHLVLFNLICQFYVKWKNRNVQKIVDFDWYVNDFYNEWKQNKRQQKLNTVLGESDKDLDVWLENNEGIIEENYSLLRDNRRMVFRVPIGKLKFK